MKIQRINGAQRLEYSPELGYENMKILIVAGIAIIYPILCLLLTGYFQNPDSIDDWLMKK